MSTYSTSLLNVARLLKSIDQAPQAALPECKDRAISQVLKYGTISHDLVWQIRQCRSPFELSSLPYKRPELFLPK